MFVESKDLGIDEMCLEVENWSFQKWLLCFEVNIFENKGFFVED